MDLLDLTTKLISIPSFVDEQFDETQLADYICSYIDENIPWVKVYKEYIDSKRYNIIAYSSELPRIVFVSHMDTVLAAGNLKQRLAAKQEGDFLYGLGACDMKGGLACSLDAVAKLTKPIPLALVFTCDEEYYFAGIKSFIKDYKAGELPLNKAYQPEIVIFPEPSDLEISYGCRGCVELELTLVGKTAHAGKPQAGINAIEKAVELIGILKDSLAQGCQAELGYTSVNLASIQGGIQIDKEIQSRANAIADIAKIVLDIRTASQKQDAKFIISIVEQICQTLNLKLVESVVKLDLSPYIASTDKLKVFENALLNVQLNPAYMQNLSFSGYGEFAMLGAELGWNAINFGPGLSLTAHQIKECVQISELYKVSQIYQELFKLLDQKR
jgi:succinyl-diaminopimelate desuccinylase